MQIPTRRYDSLWYSYNSDVLKKMSGIWGASAKLAKADRVAYLVAAPNDPHLVDAALTRMLPHERAALGLVKLAGGTADITALGIAVRVTGPVPDTDRYHSASSGNSVARTLLERGVVMQTTGYQYLGYGFDANNKQVFADDRVLARLKLPDYKRLPLKPADAPPTSTLRRVPSVMLEVISILRAVDDLGGIGLTKVGAPRTNDVRKVARKFGWGEQIEIDGLTFPEPMKAYIAAMSEGGLLAQTNGALVSARLMEQIVRAPATEIGHSLMCGILQADDWLEITPDYVFDSYRSSSLAGRLAVVAALRCLPNRTAWFRFADFERALFDRIGEFHSIQGVEARPYVFRQTAEEQHSALEAWRQEVRAAWEQNEVPWLQAVFRTWLYAFGLVELHLIDDGVVDRFRLTDLGRAVLWEEALPEQAQAAETQTSAWIVQPNFEAMVYLASASTAEIAFLEQYAERIQIAQHTAQYRLTRDSVYEGLQRGGNADALIAGLTSGSRVALPSNVQSEIRTWAALRERITVRQRADLIEFTDATVRQDAIARGLQGLPVADRFLLLPENYQRVGVLGAIPDTLDYTQKPDRRALILAENGVITLGAARSDLLTRAGLDLWAERVSDSTWRLTRKSVEEAMQRGRKAPELQAFLQERLMHAIPGLLLVALQAWTGAPVQTNLSTAVILQCTQSAVLDALLQSKALQPHILGRIGPNTILVKSADVDAVRAILEWAGVLIT